MAEQIATIPAEFDYEREFLLIAALEQRVEAASRCELSRRAARLLLSDFSERPLITKAYESLVGSVQEKFRLNDDQLQQALNRSENRLREAD